ncbi:hypothetical protein GCM10028803_60080 [Larkinella knui]|uniref:Uncharacterized protein n=1 Tax=Larkinella knui TaxID=2025310 RepID=A0A3P1CAT3_9BACT|nr:hypothetical protein [Larkinella knui]RRB10350.1 hypothetical protein EHT87_29430 [Larkinella knui]
MDKKYLIDALLASCNYDEEVGGTGWVARSDAGTMLLEPLPVRQSGTLTQRRFREGDERCKVFSPA